jgi:predicted outer membrane repeat protein
MHTLAPSWHPPGTADRCLSCLVGLSAPMQGAVHIHACSFESNSADYGGALSAIDGNIYIDRSFFAYNDANRGQLLSCSCRWFFRLRHKTLGPLIVWSCAMPPPDGGAIYVARGKVQLLSTLLMTNSARRNGGGIYTESSDALLMRSALINNRAIGGGGGGVYMMGLGTTMCDANKARA